MNTSRLDKKSANILLILLSFSIHQTMIIAGVNMSIFDIFLFIVIFRMYLIDKWAININHLLFLFIMLFVYLFNGCLIIPFLTGIDVDFINMFGEISKICLLFFCFQFGIYLDKQLKINSFIAYFSYSAVFITLFSLIITITGIEPFYSLLYQTIGRLNGFIIDPNYFAIMELSAIPYFINNNIGLYKKILCMLLLILGITLSGSKTGFISLVIYFIYKIVKFLLDKNINFNKKIVFGVIISFIIIGFITYFDKLIYYLNLYFPISSRVTNLLLDFKGSLNESGSSRIGAWISAIQLLFRFPILGVGKGNNTVLSKMYYSNSNVAHNTYIQILVDWGIPLTLIVLVYFIYKYEIVKRIDSDPSFIYKKEILLIFLLGSFGISFDNSRMLWLIIGSILV